MSFEQGGLTICDSPSQFERAVSIDFDYESVFRNLDQIQSQDPDHSEAAEAIRKLMAWIWQAPLGNPEGLLCRTTIVCWIFLPMLRGYTMTEMAGRIGKKKQSLGRWAAHFKQTFPEVAQHIQHLRNE